MALPDPEFNCNASTPPNVDPTTGKYVPPDFCKGTLDYSNSECANNDSKYIESLGNEALNIAAGPVHIFPLLGIHNQGTTIDLIGAGYPLSSGTPAGYNILDAFNSNPEVWRSVQLGSQVTQAPAFIGYNFGSEKAASGLVDKPRPIMHEIRTLKIKQSAIASRRATQIRVEASNDGSTWIRVDVINLMNVPDLVTYGIKASGKYQYWRIVPLMFTGVVNGDAWEIVHLQMLNDNQLSILDIQDKVLMENRDRAYSLTSICVKAQYDLIDVQTELERFGINLPKQYVFTANFGAIVSALGRPIIIGDILELPGETQYDVQLRPVRQWLEVTDVTWATDGIGPNWRPTLVRFFAEPLMPSQENRDLLGVPEDRKTTTDGDFLSGMFPLNVQAQEVTDAIIQDVKSVVPQVGTDAQELASGEDVFGTVGSDDQRGYLVEDAYPRDGGPYTEGPTMPDNPSDGDYHRLTYDPALKIPARLFRWNLIKNRWIFQEMDKRGAYRTHRPNLNRVLTSATKKNLNEAP
jgi:hypothetical protein